MEIEELIGTWTNEDGNKLIFNLTKNKAIRASFISGKTGTFVKREYFNNRSTTNMRTLLDSYNGEIEVDLWLKDKGFTLHFTPYYDINKFSDSRLMEISISRYEEDDFLDKYMKIFESFKHYKKTLN